MIIEGIGVASYLLVGFWYTRVQANKSAIKAITVNRVGDALLSVGFFAVLWSMGNLDYATVFSVSPIINETTVTLVSLCFLAGAMSKSANIPLHTWLPDAMEGPTPVSALIHAATLVTAGVYLLLRSSPVLEYAPTALMVITWIGALTALFAATTGLLQNDTKRVIAFSTCSQIGYLVMSVGCSQYGPALFHLVNHAYFKALLFLAAGSLIHGIGDQQDLRRLGGLVSLIPITYVAMLIGSLSLIALPFLTGFYSKDLLLELAYGRFTSASSIAYWAGTLSAGLTAFYSFRLLTLGFLSWPNATKAQYSHVHEAPLVMMIPLVVLSILAIGFGFVAKDAFVGVGSDMLSSALYTHPGHVGLVEAEFALPQMIKLLPAILSIGGAVTAYILFSRGQNFLANLTLYPVGRTAYRFLNSKWRFDAVYNSFFIIGAMRLGHTLSKAVDRGSAERVGPTGLAEIVPSAGQLVAQYDTGVITAYALYITLGVLGLIALLFAPTILGGALAIDAILLFVVGLFFVR